MKWLNALLLVILTVPSLTDACGRRRTILRPSYKNAGIGGAETPLKGRQDTEYNADYRQNYDFDRAEIQKQQTIRLGMRQERERIREALKKTLPNKLPLSQRNMKNVTRPNATQPVL